VLVDKKARLFFDRFLENGDTIRKRESSIFFSTRRARNTFVETEKCITFRNVVAAKLLLCGLTFDEESDVVYTMSETRGYGLDPLPHETFELFFACLEHASIETGLGAQIKVDITEAFRRMGHGL
jgi:hypothetical protein